MSLRRFFRRRHWDHERAQEMDAHIALMADDLQGRGLSREEAHRRARAHFGNTSVIREEIYAMNSIPLVETLMRDGRYALRLLRKSPGFALTAILTLGIAIGANAAIFSLVDAVLIRPLPYPQPEQLANAERVQMSRRGVFPSVAIDGAMWEALKAHVESANIAVFSDSRAGVNLSLGSQPMHAYMQRVGSGFFNVLGVRPALGREFTPEEDVAGGPNAIILSHSLWQNAFGADPGVVNTSVLVRGEPHTVVGVMPESYRGTLDADVWTPLRASRRGQGGGTNFGTILRVTGNRDIVEAELNAAYNSLGFKLPEGVSVWYRLAPLKQTVTSGYSDPLYTMWAAVGLVLLLACVNLAGLLLARARTRTREIATRMALGSGRRAVVRQLLVESATLAILGWVTGIAIGYLMLNGLQSLAGTQYALWQDVTLDWRAVAVTGGISMLAAIIFGVIPALHASRLDVQAGLREGDSRGASAASGGWTRRALVVGEVALGVVLLVGAGLLTRTFLSLQQLEPGFDPIHVITATASLEDKRYQSAERVNQLFEQTLDRIRAIPGVESAAVSLGAPYQRILNMGFKPLEGKQAADKDTNFIANVTYVTPGYFNTLRIARQSGRVLDESDRAGAAPSVVVNERFQTLFYPEGVIGRRIGIANAEREVVGVVANVQQRQSGILQDAGPIHTTPIVYLPAAQTPAPTFGLVHTWFSPTWIVRTSGTVPSLEQHLRAAVSAVDPQLPLASVRSMSEVRALAAESQRFLMVLAAMLGAASMLLAAIGIHGLIASSITERTREIGIRLALGSSVSQAVRVLAWPGIAMTIIGIALGVILAWGLTGYIASLLWGVQPTDPATFGIVGMLLLAVATVASVLPALRIMRLDPAKTLRA